MYSFYLNISIVHSQFFLKILYPKLLLFYISTVLREQNKAKPGRDINEVDSDFLFNVLLVPPCKLSA